MLTDIAVFRSKIESVSNPRIWMYLSQYNSFWTWKISVEAQSPHHILDDDHLKETSEKLLAVLPKWQTYRGVKSDYRRGLPLALSKISDAYNEIRQYSLLEFDRIPDDPLRFVWEILASVKEKQRTERSDSAHFVIAACKPLMFLWGQTLAFDSINRIRIGRDTSLQVTRKGLESNRWTYSRWKDLMQDFQRALQQRPDIINFCRSYSSQLFGSDIMVPYGRYLDLYYYY